MDQLQVQTGNERLKRLMLSLAKPEKWKATEELAAASLRAYAADERLARVDTVIIIGHGTSLATAMNAEFLFSRAAGAAARAVPAYQFRSYARDYLKRPERTLVVGISCSGNTESVVKGLEAARQAGALAMGITGRRPTDCRSSCRTSTPERSSNRIAYRTWLLPCFSFFSEIDYREPAR